MRSAPQVSSCCCMDGSPSAAIIQAFLSPALVLHSVRGAKMTVAGLPDPLYIDPGAGGGHLVRELGVEMAEEEGEGGSLTLLLLE